MSTEQRDKAALKSWEVTGAAWSAFDSEPHMTNAIQAVYEAGMRDAHAATMPDRDARKTWFEFFYASHLPMKFVPNVGVPCECGNSEGESYSGHLAREFSYAVLALLNKEGD